jgi:hypothetical protein
MHNDLNPIKIAVGLSVLFILLLSLTISTALADDNVAGQEVNSSYLEKTGLVSAIRQGRRHIAFEVAENGLKFGFDQGQPLDANGFPLYGNNFVTQGYIYPLGTLKPDAKTGLYNGVNHDGTAEFPDKVLGVWICRGWVFGDEGFNIATGPVVVTTQIYDFHEITGHFGKITLVTDGTELIDENVSILRAVTGGTGPYKQARGQVKHTLLGLNGLGGVSLTYRLQVK